MAFIIRRGKTKFVYLPVTTSTAFTINTLVCFDPGQSGQSNGLLQAVTTNTPAANVIGVVRHTIASTDSDYATARSVEVEVPVDRYTEWEADVTASLVAGDIGGEVDLTDNATVKRSSSTTK